MALKITLTFEPKVVDPYNLGDSWSVDRDLSSGKSVPFSGGAGGLLGRIGESRLFAGGLGSFPYAD